MSFRKYKSSGHSKSLKFLSLLFLLLISIGVLTVFLMSIPEKVEVKAKFNSVSLYISGGSYRFCLVYLVTNPKPYKTLVYVTVDLRDADIGMGISTSNVLGIVDNSTKNLISYDVSGSYILKFVLEMSANEIRAILVLL
ncbi:MAG: hypothetical protein QW743_06940 [Candidatus Methanomethylicia archaeon]